MNRKIVIIAATGAILSFAFLCWVYFRSGDRPEPLDPNSQAVKQSITANKNKVLVIGVDGMAWPVAMEMVNQGRMPNLERLIAHGTHGVVNSEPPPISSALWTTVSTGQTRKVHGIDNLFTKIHFEYREERMTSRFSRAPAIWQMMSWAGKNVGVVNWRATFPAEELAGGVFIAEGMEPGSVTSEMVKPEEWLSKINSMPRPEYQPFQQEIERIRDYRLKKAYDLDRMTFTAALEIMREKRPDLMMVCFQNMDPISRGFWKYHRPMGLDHHYPISAPERYRYGDVIGSYYQFIDRLIGGLLGEAEGYTVIVISPYGQADSYPPHNIFPNLNRLLERLEYLRYEKNTCDKILNGFADAGELTVPDPVSANIFALCQSMEEETKQWILRGEDMMDPAAVEAYISVHLKFNSPEDDEAFEARMKRMVKLAYTLVPGHQRRDIRWDKTSVWNGRDHNTNIQGLYINVENREPEGIIEKKNYKSFRKSVIKTLRALRTETGRPLFKSIRANPDKKDIPETKADPPDILVDINKKAWIEFYAYKVKKDPDPIPLAALRWSYSDVSAEHTSKGVFILSGQNAKTFKRLDVQITDIAPTLLWLTGLPVGADMPGRILSDAFDEPLSKTAPIYIESWDRVIEKKSVKKNDGSN